MFRFEDPVYLYGLLSIPILIIIHFFTNYRKRKRLRLFGDYALVKELMPDVSRVRVETKFWLVLAALALLIVMLARPQMGTRVENVKRTGIETIIAMDISNSMLAQDVVPSRLSKSKMLVETLVDKFDNDKIGLIVFAGSAFVQLPITNDFVSAKMFLQNISPSMMQSQGTNLSEAISLAMNSFTKDEEVGKAIIVITDGEDHEGGAVQMAEEARKKGMRVYMLGVGLPNGAPIPSSESGDYLTDRSGEIVMSRLNEDMCKQIAAAGGGSYIHVDNTNTAQVQLDKELSRLAKKDMSSAVYNDYDEQFRAFGIVALLFLILEVCILERKNKLLKNINLFKRS